MSRYIRSLVWLLTILAVSLPLSFRVCPAIAASDYPNRPIQLIVAYPPGGGSDLGSRIIAERLGEFLGQPVMIANKPGAGGVIGITAAAKSKPDGYTIANCSTTPLIILPLTKTGLEYGMQDFELICAFAKIPVFLSVKPDAPWKDLREFVAEAKKSSNRLRYSTYGAQSLVHFAMEAFAKEAGISLTHIPYPGSPQALSAVMGGHVEVAITTGTGGLLGSGSVRALATAEEKRLDDFPDVPTFREQGYDIVMYPIYGHVAPKGTPKEIIQKLYGAHQKAFEKYKDSIMEALKKAEYIPMLMGPIEFQERFKRDWDHYSKLLQELGGLIKE
jgi:tripartite-type tricarboxylate transporter receptor subunit TctC